MAEPNADRVPRRRATFLVPQALGMPFVALVVAGLVPVMLPRSIADVALVLSLFVTQIATMAWLFVRVRRLNASWWIFFLGVVVSVLLCLAFEAAFLMPGIT